MDFVFRYISTPAGIWCENDVGSTSMRRHHVASTLIRRHFGTKCPLGTITVLKRGKQALLECNDGILNMVSISKPTAANYFKQYFAAHSGLL